jgi:hypothetical protein
MWNWYDARPCWDDGPPIWRPQPGEVLAGVIHQYTICQTPQGLVRMERVRRLVPGFTAPDLPRPRF